MNSSQKSNELVLAGSGTTFRTLILMLFGNTLKNSDRDSVPIPCPLTDSFESEFRTDVSDVRDTFLRMNLEVPGRSPSLRAPAAHGVSSLGNEIFKLAKIRAFKAAWFTLGRYHGLAVKVRRGIDLSLGGIDLSLLGPLEFSVS